MDWEYQSNIQRSFFGACILFISPPLQLFALNHCQQPSPHFHQHNNNFINSQLLYLGPDSLKTLVEWMRADFFVYILMMNLVAAIKIWRAFLQKISWLRWYFVSFLQFTWEEMIQLCRHPSMMVHLLYWISKFHPNHD